jgi:hypothetical protein
MAIFFYYNIKLFRMRKVGDKEAVYYGEAEHTAGGLRREDLIINKKGKIVSKAQHEAGKRKIEHMRSVQGGRFTLGEFFDGTSHRPQGGSFRSFLGRANPTPRGGWMLPFKTSAHSINQHWLAEEAR